MFRLKTAATTLDEIVFENRNKLYGAYWLRTHYMDNVVQGLYLATTFIAVPLLLVFLFGATFQKTSSFNTKKPMILEKWVEVTIPEKVVEATPVPSKAISAPAKAEKAIATIENPPPVVSLENPVEEPPKQEILVSSASGLATNKGDSGNTGVGTSGNGTNDNPSLNPGDGNGTANGDSEKNWDFAEVMPMPATDAVAFIARHIIYPEVDIRNEVSGTVYIAYVVGLSGAVEDVEIVKGVSPTIDAAAIAAVRKLPPYTPGRQGNRTVRVRLRVPVRFKLN